MKVIKLSLAIATVLAATAAHAQHSHPGGQTCPAMPSQGTDVASFNAQFPKIVLWRFFRGVNCWREAGTLDPTISGMLDRELLLLAQDFRANGGDEVALHQLAVYGLSAHNLVRWQAAFSAAQINPAVSAYATSLKQQQYFGAPAIARQLPIAGGGMPPPLPKPDPQIDMTVREIYEEFRLAPGATAQTAMGQALLFIAIRAVPGVGGVYGFWKGGKFIGTHFYQMMERIDPSYGYDLVMTYGLNFDSPLALPLPLEIPTGNGTVPYIIQDGQMYDLYGNVIDTNVNAPPPGQQWPGVDSPGTYYFYQDPNSCNYDWESNTWTC